MPNCCVGIQQDIEPAPGQRFRATVMEIPAPGRDMLPTTAAFSEPSSGSLWPGKLTQKQSSLLQAEIVRMGAELSLLLDISAVIWCLYPETIVIARAVGDPSQAVSYPEITNNERRA